MQQYFYSLHFLHLYLISSARLESPTRRLYVSGTQGVELKSPGGDLSLSSLEDLRFISSGAVSAMLILINKLYPVTYRLINLLECFFSIEGHVALDRNSGPGYDTLLLRLIPGDF